MMDATVAFFENLARRKWKENDLSDVTYAALQSNSGFRQFFLDYFFSDFKLRESDVEIEREHATALGRPDFWITENLSDGNKRLFIVEVKIWDRNHHFDQYYNILKDDAKPSREDDATKRAIWSRLGYISNYEVDAEVSQDYSVDGSRKPKDIGCQVKTWCHFAEKLAEKLNESPLKTASLSRGFLSYLKSVCPYDDFKLGNWKFNPSDFVYIRKFAEALHNVEEWAKGTVQGGVRAYNRSSRQFSSKWRMGQYLEFVNNGGVNVWGWVGTYYDNDGAKICIEFEDTEGWGRVVCNQYRKKVANGALRFYSVRWNVKEDPQNQLHAFWKSVILDILAEKDKSSDGGWTFDRNDAVSVRPLLSMKALPVFLESVALANNKKFRHLDFGVLGQFELTLGEAKNDQEVPESHCGRYFELRRIEKTNLTTDVLDKTDQESVRTEMDSVVGWIGAMYNSSKDGGKYGIPCLEIELDHPFATLLRAAEKNGLGWHADAWGWTSVTVTAGEEVQSQEDLLDAIAEKFLGLQ